MLVLSRGVEQTIHIGEDVVIKVISVQGGKVRIGIAAPRDVVVLRGELVEKAAEAAAEVVQD